MMDYHLLPQFRPARLQDLILWYEPWSFRGRAWRNLAPCYSDRNHGTAHGGVGLSTWHPQFAPALELHAEDDYVKIADNKNLRAEPFTIEICFIWDNLGTDNVNFLCGKGLEIKEVHTGHIATNGLRFIPNGYPDSAVDVQNIIHEGLNYGIFTFTGSEAYVYLDGELVGSKTGITPENNALNDTSSFYIGQRNGGVYRFKGKIILFRFYKKALSEDETRHNYTHHPLYFLQRGIDPYMFVKRGEIYVP